MLKYGQEYLAKGIDYYEKLYKEKIVKTLSKKASEFGYVLIKKELLAEGVS